MPTATRWSPSRPTRLRADGTLAPVRVDPLRVELSDGPAVFAFITDLSERRATEEALRSSEYRYRTLAEQATDAIFITDRHHRLVDVNPAGCALLGYTRDELLALTIDDLVPQLATPEGRAQLNVLRADAGVLVEFLLPRKDGSRVPVELTARMLSDGQIHAIVRDISARKAAAAERDRLAAAVEQTSDAIVVTAVDGSILYVNPAFERTFRLHGARNSLAAMRSSCGTRRRRTSRRTRSARSGAEQAGVERSAAAARTGPSTPKRR